MKQLILYLLSFSFIISMVSCDFLFGTRQDDEVDDIFDQGALDPNLIPKNVGYVPILPIWNNFTKGALSFCHTFRCKAFVV